MDEKGVQERYDRVPDPVKPSAGSRNPVRQTLPRKGQRAASAPAPQPIPAPPAAPTRSKRSFWGFFFGRPQPTHTRPAPELAWAYPMERAEEPKLPSPPQNFQRPPPPPPPPSFVARGQRTRIPGTNNEWKACGHACSFSSLENCCACMDRRPFAEDGTYPRYIDGSGWQNRGKRSDGYCPTCKP